MGELLHTLLKLIELDKNQIKHTHTFKDANLQ